jgi:hypothetical protein
LKKEDIFENDDEMDEDEKAILKFIVDNPGITENKLAIEMNKKTCAPVTTKKKVRNLIRMVKVEDRRIKSSGFHELHASNKNQFNLISLELSQIKRIIDLMHEPNELLKSRLDQSYIDTISVMLRFLVLQTTDWKMSSHDEQLLHTTISKLMLKLNLSAYNVPQAARVLRNRRRELNTIRGELPNESWAKGNVMNFKLLDELISKSEEYERKMIAKVEEYNQKLKAKVG